MSRNGSGVYSIPNTFTPNTVISSSQVNANFSDVATALTNSIASDGQTTTSASIPFALGLTANTINERTSNSGVTVEGVLLKDGRVDWSKAADVASATTPDIYDIAGNYVVITGTTTITGFATAPAGVTRWVRFSGILQLTHNATTFILLGGANITTAAGDIAVFISEGSGNWRMAEYSPAAGAIPVSRTINTVRGVSGGGALTSNLTLLLDTTFLPGFLAGLTLSNNVSDSTNDIDIAIGSAVDSTSAYFMKLGTGLTKRIDAAWAVGTNQGWLDTGTVSGGNWYHVYLIARSDTGVVDSICSLSATSPTLPANYDYFRRIGAVFYSTLPGILAFNQQGDTFLWSVIREDYDSTIGTTASLIPVTAPLGVKTTAIVRGMMSGASPEAIIISSPDQSNEAPSSTFNTSPAYDMTGATANVANVNIRTDTSSQIRARATANVTSFALYTKGYIDSRGKS